MRNSQVKLTRATHAVLSLVVVFSFLATVTGQTDSCSQIMGGVMGLEVSNWIPDPTTVFCNEAPGDITSHVGGINGSIDVTCRNCVPSGPNHPPTFSKGGTASCANFDQQMVIEFSQPVADLEWQIEGARTVTDNRGYTIHMNPPTWNGFISEREFVKFPGSGITRLTISDPIVRNIYNPDGSILVAGYWEIDSVNTDWVLGSAYDQCNCNQAAIQVPPTQNVSSGWPFDLDGVDPNWSMLVQTTPNDGLVLRDIKLGQRYMVEKISVPYFYLETSALTKTRGELRPDGTETSMRSRLVKFDTATDDTKLVVEATYVIDQIPAGSQSCLEIIQRYEFYRTKAGDNCEPSATLPCSRWKPIVKYKFTGQNGETLRSVNIAQRQHRMVDDNWFNSVGLFRDSDGLGESISNGSGFTKTYNPLTSEWYDTLVVGGQDAKQWDNVHQTFYGIIGEPGVSVDETPPFIHIRRSGCPECIHSHWRWGLITGVVPGFAPEGNGKLIGIPDGSKQNVDFGVVAYQNGEEHPLVPYNDLVNGLVQYWQAIRTHNTAGRNPLQVYRDSAPEDVVYWQSATVGQSPGQTEPVANQDTFFAYGGFFNPTLPGQQLYGATRWLPQSPIKREWNASVNRSTASAEQDAGTWTTAAEFDASPDGALAVDYSQDNGRDASTGSESSNTSEDSSATTDGITSVTATQIFASGSTTIAAFDANLGGPLPAGYSQYNSLSFDVNSTAESSGPDTITFSVPSVTDQAVFDNLRIFHLEQDPYDPDGVTWVDRTVLSPDPQAPDFTNKTINARANFLGQYVVASLTQPQPPNTNVADISLSSADSPDGVVAGSDLTYTLTVTNNGPQAATGVVFSNSLSPQVRFVSVSSTQGTCKEADGTVVCKLGSIDTGNNATINLVVKPVEDPVPFPTGGKVISDTAFAKANESDPNVNNNAATENTTILPDSNSAPTVSITSPVSGTLLIGPTNISVSATASDSDGSISKVDFYGDGNLIGTATAAPYALAWNNVSFGPHSTIAVATDNLNKTKVSDPVTVIVNGSAAVAITSPANYATYNRSANVPVTASATLSGGTISKVDFYLDGFISLGTGALVGPDQYSVTWNGATSGKHVLTAVATDNSNVTTTSAPINFTVNEPPVISLTAPAGGSVITPSPATVNITSNASDWDGFISKVDFYANGTLVGTSTRHGVNQFNLSWSNVASGNYSLTAVAIDDAGASTISAPVNIRVNASPTASVTSPAAGAQFSTPTNITITATASDADGTISNVDVLANGYRIGSASSIGGNQYSFTWNGVGVGQYILSVRATDNDGASITTGVVATVTSPVLFVTGSTTLNSSDTAVKTRLEALGSTVTVKDAASATTADANGKALVVISSTVSPTSLGTKFRTVTVPVVIWESGSFNNMGMTGSTNKDFGTKTNQTQVSITNSTHPLAAGLSGTVTVVSSGKTFDWGKPNANAISVATVVGDTAKTTIFGYENGAVMPGLTAPARRVGLFLYDDTAASFTTSGTALLDSAIKWARGGASISGTLAISSGSSSVNLTSEGMNDWAHWGLVTESSFDHKAGITPLISNYTVLGTAGVLRLTDNPTMFSWSDGAPTLATVNTSTGVFVNASVGNGFQITVPADTNLRTLKLYLGLWYAQGKMEATLSDGSAPAYVDTGLSSNAGTKNGVYTIAFKAASSGQTLRIRYTMFTNFFAPYGNITLESATLQ
jgi:uncharacterized repeat protein (TIGR01451 family)